MEQMFEPPDLNLLRTGLKLSADANYESVIAGLYYASQKRRKNLIDSVSLTTKKNFDILQSIVNKRLDHSRKLQERE